MAGNTGSRKGEITATGDAIGVFFEAVTCAASNARMGTGERKGRLVVIEVVDAE